MRRVDSIDRSGWCCVQSGHRELYGIPRALQRRKLLDHLVTDLWVPPDSWMSRIPAGARARRLRDRFHAELSGARITSFPLRALAWEAVVGWRGKSAVLAHNAWWSELAARQLPRAIAPSTRWLFSYCYEARALFAAAEQVGLSPVLGQIDPGPVEDRKVAELTRRWSEYRTSFQPGSADYYDSWREECRLATHILVNSDWSREALVRAGIDARKIAVCPLVYAPPVEAADWSKTYPRNFTSQRPLRVLFLGQCILRKGIAETIAAARALRHQPVEFTLVGNTNIADLGRHFAGTRITYRPRVTRAECHAYYRDADVFLFPTHSDGFGLTQLEAQAWKLPIVASHFCGEVVRDGTTGWLMPEVSETAIVSAIEEMLADPRQLERRSRQIVPWFFGFDQLAERLEQLGAARRPVPVTAGSDRLDASIA